MISKKIFLEKTSELFGKKCCRKRVGEWNSLSLGFGKKIPHGKKGTTDSFYGEWELGTFSSAWRLILNDNILCGSMDAVDSFEELDEKIQEINFGVINSIEVISNFDIRVIFDDGLKIEFFYLSSDSDEVFHIFGPNSLSLDYDSKKGWRLEKKGT